VTSDDTAEPRLVGPLLMLGLLTLPALFGWLLLRHGYPSSLRRAVLAYALFPALTIVANLIETVSVS